MLQEYIYDLNLVLNNLICLLYKNNWFILKKIFYQQSPQSVLVTTKSMFCHL